MGQRSGGGAIGSEIFRRLSIAAVAAFFWSHARSNATVLPVKRLVFLAPIGFALSACKQDPPPAASAPPPGSSAPAAPAAVKALAEGDAAPDVALPLQSGKTVRLADFKGKPVAVYFYPADATPGCTIEAQGIRDTWEDLQKEGVVVLGVSSQGADSHKAFIEKEKLPYDLVIDDKGAVASAFGVPMNGGYHARQTYLVGKDGKIKKVWPKVTPTGHAQEILAAAKGLFP